MSARLITTCDDLRLTGSDHAVSNTSNNPANDQDCVGTRVTSVGPTRGDLKDCTNDHDEATPERGALATPNLSVEEDQHRTKKAANLVQSNGSSLCVRITGAHLFIPDGVVWRVEPAEVVCARQWCHKREVALEVVKSKKTTHNALIVPEHEEGQARRPCDGAVERFTAKLAVSWNVPFW